jgi:hypothetical protein
MREVTFPLTDRLVLIPVELNNVFLSMIIAAAGMLFLGGVLVFSAVVSAFLAGVVLFPVLLPWLPTGNFSTKGFLLGGAVALPFVLASALGNPDWVWWERAGWVLIGMFVLSSVTAFLALNFTGSTPFASRSGVRREIFTYIPVMAVLFGTGVSAAIVLSLRRVFGG